MCYSLWYKAHTMLPATGRLSGIINKPLLLHLVGVYIVYINDARSKKYQIDHKNFVALVRKRIIPTERPPPFGEVSANFRG